MAKGQLDDPLYYNLSDGTNSTVVNPWGQGDSATALRVIHAGDATASVSIVSNIATLDVQLVSGSVASVYANNPSGQGDSATALRIIHAGDSGASVSIIGNIATLDVKQMSGDISSVSVTSITAPVAQGDSASALRVIHAGDATASVSIVSNIATLDVQLVSGSVASVYANNPSGAGDGATALRIIQAGDFVSSVYVNNPFGPGDSATALRMIYAGDSGASVNVITALPTGTNIIGALSANQSINNAQVSGNTVSVGDGEVGVGTMRIVHAADIGASVSATQVGTWNIGTVTTVTGVTNSIAAANIDSTGVQYSGSNPFPTSLIGGGLDSMFIKLARTTNPTAVSDGADIRPITDKIGRQIVSPYQVRDLVSTAFISLATSAGYNTEKVLIATGAAGVMNDILELSGTNDSTVAAIFDLRCGTANANVSKRISIPASANGMYHEDFNIPLLGEVTTPWTVKAFISGGGSADITGNNVTLHASYTKNV